MNSIPVQDALGHEAEQTFDAPLDLRRLLDAAEGAPPAEGVDTMAAVLADTVSATQVSLLIADISGALLARLARAPAPGQPLPLRPAGEGVPINGTPAGKALQTQRVQVDSDPHGFWVYVPVSERGEALGVLELLFAVSPSETILDYLASAGHALAYVVIADRRFSDLYELGERSTMLTLAAEIQRRLLPGSYACQGPQFALAGWLVAADEAGGDTFDYMVDRDTLHLSVTDAMGHGVAAAQLATLGVGSLRNSRRQGLGLVAQAEHASKAIAEYATADQFVTALLGRIDLATGSVEWVNAGHMNPLLVRDGQVTEIALDPDLVLGVVPDASYEVQHFQLSPGDRLALVTDGMSERDAANAEINALLGTLGHLHPRETVKVLTDAVLHVTGGAMRDDATVLIIDWYGHSREAATLHSIRG